MDKDVRIIVRLKSTYGFILFMSQPIKEKLSKLRDGFKEFVQERMNIAEWTAKAIEDGLRTGKRAIIAYDLPLTLAPSLSEERRKRIRENRHKLLENFEAFKKFSERRIFD